MDNDDVKRHRSLFGGGFDGTNRFDNGSKEQMNKQ
jgi:hypothetical protein